MNHIAKRPASRLMAYLALLRPANVTTAIADVLAGFGVAGMGNSAALPWLLTATACLYAGGVVLNDVFDRRLDEIERPERPIPSGRVPATVAGAIGAVLLLSGVAAASRASSAAAILALAIATLAVLYDGWGKHRRFIGPINMALCRGLNLLLGVAAVPAALGTTWPIALLPIAYISGVTAISRGEVHGGSRQVATMSLGLVATVVAALLVMSVMAGPNLAAGLALTLLLAWRVLPAFWRARRDSQPHHVRLAVRTGVLSLVLLDAAIGAVYAGAPHGLLILAMAPIAWLLARPFAVT